ncbi:MAG: hypothetical protein QF394_07600 [Rhodospirillales bacterium]|nr:hypothetical protein [Rhodospirillales bacterium]
MLRCTQSGATHQLDIFAKWFDKTVFKYICKKPEAGCETAFAGLEWDIENSIHRTSPAKECLIARNTRHNAGRSYGPFSGVYYLILNHVSYDRDLVKPSWSRPEMLDKAR